jgi:hypothetical protein
MEILDYLGDEIYVFVLFSIMIIAGIVKEHNLFGSTYGWLKCKFKSNKLVITLLSLVSGIIPIEGRSSVSAGILDTATSQSNVVGQEAMNDHTSFLHVESYRKTSHTTYGGFWFGILRMVGNDLAFDRSQLFVHRTILLARYKGRRSDDSFSRQLEWLGFFTICPTVLSGSNSIYDIGRGRP